MGLLTMTSSVDTSVPPGFCRTCWRGIELLHPADWEPAALSGPQEPAKCILVDRRHERLELTWETVTRTPDVKKMYELRDKSDRMSKPFSGVPGWSGVVRKEENKTIVEAGRHFPQADCLVQAAVFWPERRDHQLEQTVLSSVRPQREGAVTLWQAAGLKAEIPAGFELYSSATRVGQVTWEFRRRGHRGAAVCVERYAMPDSWLKTPLGEWLTGQLPKGFKVVRDLQVPHGPHFGVDLHSRCGHFLSGVTGGETRRLDRAWICDREKRAYRMSYWQRGRGEIEFPLGLAVECCRAIPQATERPA